MYFCGGEGGAQEVQNSACDILHVNMFRLKQQKIDGFKQQENWWIYYNQYVLDIDITLHTNKIWEISHKIAPIKKRVGKAI